MATEKTSNDYREERKARLAKAAKKNAKKAHRVSASSVSKKTKATIGIVIAIAIVAGIAFGVCNSTGVFERMKKIETVSGESYSAVEYAYYYNFIHSQYYSTAQQYDQYYGEGMGYYYTCYDYSKFPEDQLYTGEDYKLDDGSKPTWKQYFEYIALKNLQQFHAMEDLAEKYGFTVDEATLNEAYASIDEMKSQLAESASESGGTPVSFGKYLREYYGKGMNEKTFKDIIKCQTISSEYSTYLMEKNSEDYLANSAKLEEEYKKDTTLYDCVDFRIFTIAPETAETASDATQEEKDAATKQAKEAAKKKADEMFAKIKDEASFIKLAEQYATEEQKETTDFKKDEATLMKYVEKATYESSFGADATKWLYSKDTKVNDKKMFDVNGTYYIFYMVKTAYRDDATIPVDVRHILYQFDDTAKDKEADKATQKAAAEATANAINKAEDKLASFLEWCEKDSDDTGSSSNGGLIEYLGRGKYVKAFEEWSLDAKRQEGDVEVIETEYGYHVMYFVKKHTAPYWKISIAQTFANDDLNKMLDDTIASDAYKVKDAQALTELNNKLYANLVETFYPNTAKAEPSTAA